MTSFLHQNEAQLAKRASFTTPVVVENAETLDENKYLIPPKEQKREWSMF